MEKGEGNTCMIRIRRDRRNVFFNRPIVHGLIRAMNRLHKRLVRCLLIDTSQ